MPKLKPGEPIIIPPELYQKMIDRVGLRVVLRAMREEQAKQQAAKEVMGGSTN